MSALPVFLHPATKIVELDLTQKIQSILGTTVAVVGEFDRGPVVPTFLNGSLDDLRRKYGAKANPQRSFAYDTIESAMNWSTNALINRVTKDAAYAGTSVLLDVANKRFIFDAFPTGGSPTAYDASGLQQIAIISITGALVTSDTFALDITDGVNTESVAVTYATSHNNTMNLIAAAIKVALDEFASDSVVTVYDEPGTGNNKLIIIRVDRTSSVAFVDLDLTSSATAVLLEDAHVADIFAENPGAWANDYGVKFLNADEGIRSRYTLTFSAALVASNSVSITVNGTPIVTVYATSSDATMAAIAAALQANANIRTATVRQVVGSVTNDRIIDIVAEKPGPDALLITSPVVTLGASQATINLATVKTGVVSDESFRMEVYNRNNVNLFVENFEVSLRSQLSSLGYQQNIEHVVNRASTKSTHIRVKQSANSLLQTIYASTTGDAFAMPTTISWLTGGDDGLTATSAEIRTGWRAIQDRRHYPLDLMLNAGYTNVAIQKEMTDIAEKRSDCMAILDAPSDKQAAQTLREYRLYELDIDSSYAAMYSPDVEIEDISTGERRFIPPSGPVGATYCYSDRLTESLGAPAGLNRGHVRQAVGLRYKYTEAEQDLIYPLGINYIEDRPMNGPVVMAEETLQVKKTVLSSVHARRILNRIKTGLVDGLDYTLFEPNVPATRFNAIQLGETLLRPMKRGDGLGGLYDYRIKCDEENNTPDIIDADQLAYDVYLKITRVIKGIYCRAILTRTGARFEEIIDMLA